MTNKHRYCNIQRSPDSMFCGNHRPVNEAPSNRAVKRARENLQNKTNKKTLGELGSSNEDVSITNDPSPLVDRIPCPIDPTHSIYKHNLEHHLKICNTKTREDMIKSKAYFCLDCNSNPVPPIQASSSSSSSAAAAAA